MAAGRESDRERERGRAKDIQRNVRFNATMRKHVKRELYADKFLHHTFKLLFLSHCPSSSVTVSPADQCHFLLFQRHLSLTRTDTWKPPSPNSRGKKLTTTRASPSGLTTSPPQTTPYPFTRKQPLH